MKKLLAIISALSMLFLSACETDGVSDLQEESSVYSEVVYADKELGMKKLIFSIMMFFPECDRLNSYYLFVQSDGSIYTGVDTDYMAKQYEFRKKLAACDDSAFDLLDEAERIGQISASETQSLVELIDKIDPNSDGFDYNIDNSGMRPDVIDTVCYTYLFYLGTAPKSEFSAASFGNHSGSFTRTYDVNALKAMSLINENELIMNWMIELESKYDKYGDSSDELDDVDLESAL